MKRLSILLITLSVALALGVSSYIVHRTRVHTTSAASMIPDETLSRFALYASSQRVLSLSNDGVLGNGKIIDTGVIGTSGSWQIIPTTSDTLLCVEVISQTQGVSPVYALWKYNAGLPLNQISISFAHKGTSSCIDGEKYLTPYSKGKVNLSSTFTFPHLDTTKLTPKGQLTLAELNQSGNFLSAIGVSDQVTFTSLVKVRALMLGNLKKPTIPDYIAAWSNVATPVLDSSKQIAYTIPAGGYGQSSRANKSYCVSYDGWLVSNLYLKPQRGECDPQGHQLLLNGDANVLLNTINGIVTPQIRLAYALGHISLSNGKVIIAPADTAHKKLIISKKVDLHLGSFMPVAGSFDASGLWCLELRNGNTQAVVTSNLVLGNQFECIPLTVNTPRN